ncbi:glycosyltransferase [Prochlorothrix hollandica]|uniref:Glycosyl transferase family 1 n=1 Tax=Prochlorothrix hollandica PCC 9006 = CALU 1027 TaxID=317619 RepID=A0A0M2PXD9_PROHO|nr:glycosyltransferase [Prochlorothrix hollandica]KKI99767.1 glycosyl transferase family 1 [Prochlorothrix hollandica PCC 9006 = CALU 1027]
MRILFLHRNFPAQFRHLALVLAQDPAHQVVFITARPEGQLPGVHKYLYQVNRSVSPQTHRYVRPLEEAVGDGQAAWRVARHLKIQQGFEPDLIYSHVGWGPGLFLRDLFPKARYLGFFEWYYHARGTDADFDPADPIDEDGAARIHVKNASILLELAHCDGGVVPTNWQKQQFPPEFQPKLRVLHDGIDTDFFQPQPGQDLAWTPLAPLPPDPQAAWRAAPPLTPTADHMPYFWDQALDLRGQREIVTYVGRGMEPYRGFPQFMAAIALVLRRRPTCQVVIVGEDRVAYGQQLPDGKSHGQECLSRLDLPRSRIHFTGRIPYDRLRQVYQASAVHVYLTRPFVLSWSLLESMACGAVVLGSRTPPVEEVITDGFNGFLVDFFDVEAIAAQIETLLDRQQDLGSVRAQARQTVVDRYNLAQLLPEHCRFLQTLVTGPDPQGQAT